MGALPMWIKNRTQTLTTSDKALTGTQIQRGQFMNSGSKDAGPDPDWDFERMAYKPHHPEVYGKKGKK